MRIAALGFHHETNTFQSVKTDYDAFAGYEFLRGGGIAGPPLTANTSVSGYLRGAGNVEVDLAPLLGAFTGPTGTIT